MYACVPINHQMGIRIRMHPTNPPDALSMTQFYARRCRSLSQAARLLPLTTNNYWLITDHPVAPWHPRNQWFITLKQYLSPIKQFLLQNNLLKCALLERMVTLLWGFYKDWRNCYVVSNFFAVHRTYPILQSPGVYAEVLIIGLYLKVVRTQTQTLLAQRIQGNKPPGVN